MRSFSYLALALLLVAAPASAQQPFDGPKPLEHAETTDRSSVLAEAEHLEPGQTWANTIVSGVLDTNLEVDCVTGDTGLAWAIPVIVTVQVISGRFVEQLGTYTSGTLFVKSGDVIQGSIDSKRENRPSADIMIMPGADLTVCIAQDHATLSSDSTEVIVNDPRWSSGFTVPYEIELARVVPAPPDVTQVLPAEANYCEGDLDTIPNNTRVVRLPYDERAPQYLTLNGFIKSFAPGEVAKVYVGRPLNILATKDGHVLDVGFQFDAEDPIWDGLPGDPDNTSASWGGRVDGDIIRAELVRLGYSPDTEVSVFVGAGLFSEDGPVRGPGDGPTCIRNTAGQAGYPIPAADVYVVFGGAASVVIDEASVTVERPFNALPRLRFTVDAWTAIGGLIASFEGPAGTCEAVIRHETLDPTGQSWVLTTPRTFTAPLPDCFASYTSEQDLTLDVRGMSTVYSVYEPVATYTLSARVVDAEAAKPTTPALALAVYPNPLVAGTGSIVLTLPSPTETHVALYDVLGRHVATIAREILAAGTHRLRVPPGLAPGTYVVRATADEVATTTLSVLP